MHAERNSSRSMSTNKRRQMKDPPSIPFLWETKPGIPKINWTHPRSILWTNLRTPAISFSNSSFQAISDDDEDDDELNGMLGFDVDTSSCTTDESSSSAPSNPESFLVLSSQPIFEANISGQSNSYPTAFTTIRPNLLIRKPHTLAELMMMSRRLSCRRNAIHMRKTNQSMEILNKFFGCFIPRRLHRRRILGQN